MTDTQTLIELSRLQFTIQAVRTLVQNSLRAPLIDLSVDDKQNVQLRTDIDIAAQYIGAAMDELEQAWNVIGAFTDPEPCATCGHGEHKTCSCRQHDDDSVEDPEPHGSRDTFVPHPDGPAPEHFNPLQD